MVRFLRNGRWRRKSGAPFAQRRDAVRQIPNTLPLPRRAKDVRKAKTENVAHLFQHLSLLRRFHWLMAPFFFTEFYWVLMRNGASESDRRWGFPRRDPHGRVSFHFFCS